MKILLRVLAILLGLVLITQVDVIVRMVLSGGLTALVHSGALGILTIAGWFLILSAGPLAVVQLWRLRRIGLFTTAALTGLALCYYLLGLLFLRSPGANVNSIVRAIIINAVMLTLLLLPRVRGACS
jgi:hypothetical protein